MEYLSILKNMCGADGVSGREETAMTVAGHQLSDLGQCESTPLGGLLCRIRPPKAGQPHLLLTAHLDQVGMVVAYIEETGFLRMANVGGLDRRIMPAARLTVHTASGAIPGVVCTVPPHLQGDGKKTVPQLSDLAIDVGLSGEAAKKTVALGDVITFRDAPEFLLDGKMVTAAADDRVGCVCVIEAARMLGEMPLACGLSVLLSSMEEVGGQGAMVGTAALAPTHALAVDVSFAMQPGVQRHACGVGGEGVMVGVSPVLNKKMSDDLRRIAQREEIPYQIEVMAGKTGTDADAVAVSGYGVQTALLSVPIRNMHTPGEVVWEKDIDAVVRLIIAWAKETFGGEG